jgi:hypothetical protein
MPISIDSKLKMTPIILGAALLAFRRAIIPIDLFSNVFSDVPRGGNEKIAVPKFGLHTTASVSRAKGASYMALAGNANVDAVEVALNKNKVQVLGAYGEDMANQPMLSEANLEKLGALAGERLAHDVLMDIFSAINPTNYTGGGSGHAPVVAHNDFDYSEVRDLAAKCTLDKWPTVGRGLIVDPLYSAGIAKSPSALDASQSADPSVFREGLVRRIAGFDMVETGAITACDDLQDLFIGGFAVHPDALFVAFAPVEPTPAIRAQLYDYQIVKDEFTGIVLEYKHLANADTNQEARIIECHYGFQPGNGDALKLIRFDS